MFTNDAQCTTDDDGWRSIVKGHLIDPGDIKIIVPDGNAWKKCNTPPPPWRNKVFIIPNDIRTIMYKGLLLFTFSHFLKSKKKKFINNNNYIKKNNAKSIHFNFYLFNHSTFFIIYFVVFCSLSRNENKIYNLILFDRVLGPIIYCEIIGIHGGLVFVDIMGSPP